jgi:phage repressor protein C with HTH and peptisase S24 domain
MKTWTDRLQEALDDSGINRSELAAKLGIKPPSVTGWFNGSTKNMNAENAFNAAKILRVNLQWLLFGIGPKEAGAKERIDDVLVAITCRTIPLLAHIDGGDVQIGDDDDDEVEPMYYKASWIKKNGYDVKRLVIREIKGSSMEGALYHGDKVLVNTASRNPRHGIAYWISVEGMPCAKRLLKRDSVWWITSDNPAHEKSNLPLENANQIIGEIVQKSSSHI